MVHLSWCITWKAPMLDSHFNKVTRHTHSTLLKRDSKINALYETLPFFRTNAKVCFWFLDFFPVFDSEALLCSLSQPDSLLIKSGL